MQRLRKKHEYLIINFQNKFLHNYFFSIEEEKDDELIGVQFKIHPSNLRYSDIFNILLSLGHSLRLKYISSQV